ncbi:dTMP kinase [Streptomyces sp. ET3-23]|uniref:dTMP kinase n=1 Tax=Streptomyces sp. ET3-23 TaxID=2885643 RepID=UPI001D0FAAF8|nr:dTMP kinase [Streptomyces sp. ET3-23]MCC2274704.1 dTMP kinase [Streptomyces sp. ET3-23]
MTRAEQPTEVDPASRALAEDSRERALRSLLRVPALRKLWSAQSAGSAGDALAVLVLMLLSLQAAVETGALGGGYRGAALAIAAVVGARLLATLLAGAVLLGPLSSLLAPDGPLDRRWTMIGADGVRLALLAAAPTWIDWAGDRALAWLLATAFVIGLAERVWTVAKDGAAPALLPMPPPEGAAVRPLPDHLDALRRLSLRTTFLALPVAAAALVAVTLFGNLLGSGIDWFHLHQSALACYLAAGLFGASAGILYFLELPHAQGVRAHSPLEGLRRPRRAPGQSADTGRTGAVPVLVLACAAIAGAVAAAVGVAALQAADLGGGPVGFGLLVLALGGGPVLGIRSARRILPGFSRRRLLVLALALMGVALLAAGLVPDPTTVLLLLLFAGFCAGIVANTGHAQLDQETEEDRRARTTEHLHAVVRVAVAVGAVAAPLLAAVIGPHRIERGSFVFAHGGAAFTLMLVGALLLPVAAVVLGKTDDRHGVPFRRDLMEVLRGGDPEQAPSKTGFFIAFEGGDGAGKSTQVQAVADWIRAKGHEVVVTREPGATAVGKRLRAILLDVASAGLSDRAEALLYAADRAEHVASVVRPALERGAVVISDRYIDSSVAYQGAGRDLAPTEIARISRWATDGLVPHLTVLLDVSPETARERFTEAPDRLESEPAEFHQRVRTGFLTLAAADPARYLVVDAGQEPEAVSTVVRHRLDQLLPLSEAEIRAQAEARRAAEEEARRKAEEEARRKAEEAARKAEEERLERERQAQLAKERAEAEERQRREREEAERREAERLAAEAARKAEEERRRREAEERAHAAEQERLRKQAAEEARLRAEAEERRLEKQRRAEEALLRAERARLAAEAGPAVVADVPVGDAPEAPEAPTVVTRAPVVNGARDGREAHGARDASDASDAPDVHDAPDAHDADATRQLRVPSGDEVTVETPAPGGAADAPTVETQAAAPDAEETRVLPKTGDETRVLPTTGDETRVLPTTGDAPTVETPAPAGPGEAGAGQAPVVHKHDPNTALSAGTGAEDETAVLPPVRPVVAQPVQQRVTWGMQQQASAEAPAPRKAPERPEDPADRVPSWLFRPEDEERREPAAPAADPDSERTRELPPVDADGQQSGRPSRRRPEWADGRSLADDLLGPRDEKDEDGRRRGRR